MAINFLNTVDLNKNQLNNAAIQNLGTDPATGVEGQIYFNTTVFDLKVYANGAWKEVGATSGVESLIAGTGIGISAATGNVTVRNTGLVSVLDGTYIDLTKQGGGDNTQLTADLSAVDGTSDATTRFLSKDNTWDVISNIAKATATTLGTVKLFSDTVQTVAATAVSATAARTYGVQFNSDDQMVVNVPWTDINVVTYTLTTTAGATDPTAITNANINLIGSDSSTDTATLAGKVQEIIVSETGDTISFALANGAFVEWGTAGTNLSLPEDTVAKTAVAGDNTTRVATTAFVQNATTGLLQLVGGFDANTGALASPLTGNLTSGAARVALEVGDYYVVTVDGDFFGNAATPLTTGDSVIVQTAAVVGASVESDFIIVQSETDLATLSTVGLGNVNASTAIDELGISVSYTTPTDGTATVGVDINAQTDMPDALANTDQVLLYDASSGKNYKASIEKFSGHGSKRVSLNTSVTGISDQVSPPAGTQGWVIQSNTVMGTAAIDCGIELMTDTVNALGAGLTVYAEVSRASNAITINFVAPSAIAQGEYQVIISRA
jgi:hypothetical protein